LDGFLIFHHSYHPRNRVNDIYYRVFIHLRKSKPFLPQIFQRRANMINVILTIDKLANPSLHTETDPRAGVHHAGEDSRDLAAPDVGAGVAVMSRVHAL
jgi:hypothetical protein